ncbi:MAG: 4-hydroxy-tetrahydrodipicolinate synthase [Pseudomonadota bacterium]|nr:4-hydroxy-tetrahydrodipicolinate synthase [Pseudomonadota bacterium]
MMTGDPLFRGSYIALVTPFSNGVVDEAAFRKLVSWQIDQGTNGLIPVGTTGESPTLSHDEHKQVVELCIDEAAGRVPVIAGAGSNATAEAVDFVRHASQAGADAVLVVTPYYNKPTQNGLMRHYEAVADASDVPVVIYDIPGRSVVSMDIDTMVALAEHDNITGVKDSSQDLSRPTMLANAIGSGFSLLSGEDGTALPFRAAGGHGCISVTANIAPRLLSDMHAAWDKGDIAEAMAINARLMPLHSAMFCETSPGPVKYAASLLGMGSADMRLPMTSISDASKQTIKQVMQQLELIS